MAAIYLLGDSHTQLLGPRFKSRAASLGHALTFESFPGQPTKLVHQKASIPSGQSVVLLSIGGNDRGDQSAARAALIAAVKLRNPGARLVWFGPFDASQHAWAGKAHDEQAEAQRKQLPGLGVEWIDTRPISKTGHAADNVHYTGTGYSQITDSLMPVVKRALAGTVSGPTNGSGTKRTIDTAAETTTGGGGGLLLIAVAVGAVWMLLRRQG